MCIRFVAPAWAATSRAQVGGDVVTGMSRASRKQVLGEALSVAWAVASYVGNVCLLTCLGRCYALLRALRLGVLSFAGGLEHPRRSFAYRTVHCSALHLRAACLGVISSCQNACAATVSRVSTLPRHALALPTDGGHLRPSGAAAAAPPAVDSARLSAAAAAL